MRYRGYFFLLLPFFLMFISCNKDLNVNADWKEITVVYGLLDQNTDTTYIKITKAFLGPGDAMMFSKIPDSSFYKDTIVARLEEFNGEVFVRNIPLDTITIHNKEKGDSIFFYPDQLMYYTTARLNENYLYKLYIKNLKTGKVVTSQTTLVHDFEIVKPAMQASFLPDQDFDVKWMPAVNGKRYQLLIRFFYSEYLKSNPQVGVIKSIDWIVFNDVKAPDYTSTQAFELSFPGIGFYTLVNTKIDTSSLVTRNALYCNFIYSVAAADMNTYMEVTEPSLSLVQEKPPFTNIINGVGLFSARFDKGAKDSLRVSQKTKDELKVNEYTKNRGF